MYHGGQQKNDTVLYIVLKRKTIAGSRKLKKQGRWIMLRLQTA
jgi:hypothetical protein